MLRFVRYLVLAISLVGCAAAGGASKSMDYAPTAPDGWAEEDAAYKDDYAAYGAPEAEGVPSDAMPMSAAAPPSPKQKREAMRDERVAEAPKPAPPGAGAAPGGGEQPATDAVETATDGSRPTTVDPVERRPMLIYEAMVRLAVFEVRKTLDGIEAATKKLGGYLVERTDTSVVVRVPAASFEVGLQAVLDAGDVLERNVRARDVTEEFLDLTTRLHNAQAIRDRLLALLERADKVPDALQVERELERVMMDIESMEGRLQYLSELVRFSTITVSLEAKTDDLPTTQRQLPFPWLGSLGLSGLLNY